MTEQLEASLFEVESVLKKRFDKDEANKRRVLSTARASSETSVDQLTLPDEEGRAKYPLTRDKYLIRETRTWCSGSARCATTCATSPRRGGGGDDLSGRRDQGRGPDGRGRQRQGRAQAEPGCASISATSSTTYLWAEGAVSKTTRIAASSTSQPANRRWRPRPGGDAVPVTHHQLRRVEADGTGTRSSTATSRWPPRSARTPCAGRTIRGACGPHPWSLPLEVVSDGARTIPGDPPDDKTLEHPARCRCQAAPPQAAILWRRQAARDARALLQRLLGSVRQLLVEQGAALRGGRSTAR